jgi:hypothetical protein
MVSGSGGSTQLWRSGVGIMEDWIKSDGGIVVLKPAP